MLCVMLPHRHYGRPLFWYLGVAGLVLPSPCNTMAGRSLANVCLAHVEHRPDTNGRCRGDGERALGVQAVCDTEKATNAWHRQGTQQNKEHPQSTQTTVNRHNSLTKHRAPSKEQHTLYWQLPVCSHGLCRHNRLWPNVLQLYMFTASHSSGNIVTTIFCKQAHPVTGNPSVLPLLAVLAPAGLQPMHVCV